MVCVVDDVTWFTLLLDLVSWREFEIKSKLKML